MKQHLEDLSNAALIALCSVSAMTSAALVLFLTSRQPMDYPAAPAGGTAEQTAAPSDLRHLARRTLAAIDRANKDADYNAFRAAASPAFQDRNTHRDLARIFAPFRRARLELAPHADERWAWTTPPHLDPQGRLDMAGRLRRDPGDIHFRLVYEKSEGAWRLLAIATDFRPRHDTLAASTTAGR